MLIVQRFHSIHEIDPEFISSIEVLLKEDVPGFTALRKMHDEAPETDVFTYFLFFGPTQNTPIGFSQVTLRKIPWQKYVPWWRRLMFWKKDHLHWKEAIWKVNDGTAGLFVFDSKFTRSGKEEMQKIIREFEVRGDVMSQHHYAVKGMQEYSSQHPEWLKFQEEELVLEPLTRSSKSYQDYLSSLKKDTQKQIKASWKELQTAGVSVGDYPSLSLVNKDLPLSESIQKDLMDQEAQLLTFEKDDLILGCLSVIKGKDGNTFFEPYPFEPESSPLVGDELYTQYALLKFFELPEARRCHLLKNGSKLHFKNKEDLSFFIDQGFQAKTLQTSFYSRLKGHECPV
jgi:hypothetical protein